MRGNKKKPYHKIPYHKNPELILHNVRKSMEGLDGDPTVDAFSDIDATTDFLSNNETQNTENKELKTRRPTREKKSKPLISTENLFLWIFGVVSAGIGIIVYTHSNKFVSVEKDIDYIKEENKEIKAETKDINSKVIVIDRKIDLLNQKNELQQQSK